MKQVLMILGIPFLLIWIVFYCIVDKLLGGDKWKEVVNIWRRVNDN